LDPDAIALATAAGFTTALRDQEKRKEILAEEPKSLPKEVVEAFTRCDRDFERDARKHRRAQARLEKAKRIYEHYTPANILAGKYPADSKPFKISETAKEWDDPYADAATEAKTIVITIPQAATLKTATAAFHYQYTLFYHQRELDAATSFAAKVQPGAQKLALVEKYKTAVAAWQENADPATVGMDPPAHLYVHPKLLGRRAEESFKAVYNKMVGEKDAELKAVAAAKKKEEETDKAHLKANPLGLLTNFVEKVFDTRAASAAPADADADTTMVDNSPEAVAARKLKEKEIKDREQLLLDGLRTKPGKGAGSAQKNSTTSKHRQPRHQPEADTTPSSGAPKSRYPGGAPGNKASPQKDNADKGGKRGKTGNGRGGPDKGKGKTGKGKGKGKDNGGSHFGGSQASPKPAWPKSKTGKGNTPWWTGKPSGGKPGRHGGGK